MSGAAKTSATTPKSILEKLKAEASEVLEVFKTVNEAHINDVQRFQDPQFGHSEYLKRLQTFVKHQTHWLVLSSYVSPITFASHGWYAHDRGYVKCGTCHALVSVKFSSSSPGPSLKYVAKYVIGKLRAGHSNKCIWSSHVANQLPEENFSVKSVLPSIKATFAKYPSIEIIPSSSVFHEDLREYLDSALLARSDDPSILLVALHAWIPNEAQTALKCRLCAVSITLEPYIMPGRFDPVKFHRTYCPTRVNTKSFQENVFLNNSDDLVEKPTISENLRSLQRFLECSAPSDLDSSVVSNASTPCPPTEQS